MKERETFGRKEDGGEGGKGEIKGKERQTKPGCCRRRRKEAVKVAERDKGREGEKKGGKK